MTKWIKKHDLSVCCLQDTHFRRKNTQAENEEMEKDIPGKWKESWGSSTLIKETV